MARTSALRIGLMVITVLALIPATIVFGLYGFIALLFLLALIAFAK